VTLSSTRVAEIVAVLKLAERAAHAVDTLDAVTHLCTTTPPSPLSRELERVRVLLEDELVASVSDV
jgi:hypothetical protein